MYLNIMHPRSIDLMDSNIRLQQGTAADAVASVQYPNLACAGESELVFSGVYLYRSYSMYRVRTLRERYFTLSTPLHPVSLPCI